MSIDATFLKPVIDMVQNSFVKHEEGRDIVRPEEIGRVGIAFNAERQRTITFSREHNRAIGQIEFKFSSEASRVTRVKTVEAALKAFEGAQIFQEARGASVERRQALLQQINALNRELGMELIQYSDIEQAPIVDKLDEKLAFLKAVSENKSLNTPIRSSLAVSCLKGASYVGAAALGALLLTVTQNKDAIAGAFYTATNSTRF